MVRAPLSEWQIFDHEGRRKYIRGDECPRFLLAADSFAARPRALCYVLESTGCRVSEALALYPHHHDVEESALIFRTLKRRKTVFRSVPIPLEVTAMLVALQAPDGSPFWTMHRSTAWRHVSRAMALAGVIGPMACCRGLRHGFGIRGAEHNVPQGTVRKWMGHARFETTAIYMDAVGIEERQFASRMWTLGTA